MIADGAMGTMLQGVDLTLDDFAGLEGCNEILNETRPDVVRHIHRAYFEAGADAVETNTFGANLPNLADYGIADRIFDLSLKATQLAREVADDMSTAQKPRYVLGSVGPGTKLPTLGNIAYDPLEAALAEQARGLIAGGVDAILIETCQDTLQIKAAVNGAKIARRAAGTDTPIFVQVTVETTGTLLVPAAIDDWIQRSSGKIRSISGSFGRTWTLPPVSRTPCSTVGSAMTAKSGPTTSE